MTGIGLLRSLRGGLRAAWILLAVLLLAITVGTNVAPRLGLQLVIVRGPSMTPTIPLGALLVERAPDAATLVPGAVVTFHTANGTIVTHRVVDVATGDGGPTIATRGDANAEADPARTPASSVTGIVLVSLPVAGFALAFLQLPSGIVAVLSLVGTLVALEWLVEDVIREVEEEAGSRVRTPAGEPDAFPA